MSLRSVLLSGAICLPLALPASAQTDPAPGLLDLLSPNRLATFAANMAIAGLRTQMEVQYEHLSTDILRGTVSVAGITARPQLPHDQAGQCEVTVDRAILSSDFATPFEDASELTLDLIGAEATLACLDRDTAMAVRSAGFDRIALDQARIKMGYVYATGETAADATIAINGLATLDFSAAGTILPRLGAYGYPGDPAIRVSRAVVSLKDRGGWAALSAMLPPNLRDPEAVRQMGTEAILAALSEGGMRSPSAVERNFVNALMDRVAAYVADPGELTIEADLPPGGIVVEPQTFDDPAALIGALALQARTAPLARRAILPANVVAGLAAPESLDDAARLTLGAALLSGAGLPRAPALVPDLVRPVAEGGGPQAAEAAALIARALEDLDPASAYAQALVAGGAEGNIATLDRLEARMTTAAVLEAQAARLASLGEAAPLNGIAGDDPRALRDAALAHLTGAGAPRSYARAYYFAVLAEAAGDIGAAPLRQEIEARFANRGDAVADLWRTTAAAAQDQALRDWIALDLPARYRVE